MSQGRSEERHRVVKGPDGGDCVCNRPGARNYFPSEEQRDEQCGKSVENGKEFEWGSNAVVWWLGSLPCICRDQYGHWF